MYVESAKKVGAIRKFPDRHVYKTSARVQLYNGLTIKGGRCVQNGPFDSVTVS